MEEPITLPGMYFINILLDNKLANAWGTFNPIKPFVMKFCVGDLKISSSYTCILLEVLKLLLHSLRAINV